MKFAGIRLRVLWCSGDWISECWVTLSCSLSMERAGLFEREEREEDEVEERGERSSRRTCGM